MMMLGPTATEPVEQYRVPTITIKRLESEKIEAASYGKWERKLHGDFMQILLR